MTTPGQRNDPTVRLQLIDVADGELFAETEIPLSHLPEQFVAEMTITIVKDEWQVVEAQPATAAEAARLGTVTLRLARLTPIDPDDMLFSLPTICDVIPSPELDDELASDDDEDGQFALHEDDWRQIEWIDARYGPAISDEFAAIRQIFAEQRDSASGAFRAVHLRQAIPVAIPEGLALTTLQQALPPESAEAAEFGYRLGYLDQPGSIPGGFALPAGPVIVYGQAEAGRIHTLGLAPSDTPGPIEAALAERLATIMQGAGLVLVDWCSMLQIDSRPADLATYLTELTAPD